MLEIMKCVQIYFGCIKFSYVCIYIYISFHISLFSNCLLALVQDSPISSSIYAYVFYLLERQRQSGREGGLSSTGLLSKLLQWLVLGQVEIRSLDSVQVSSMNGQGSGALVGSYVGSCVAGTLADFYMCCVYHGWQLNPLHHSAIPYFQFKKVIYICILYYLYIFTKHYNMCTLYVPTHINLCVYKDTSKSSGKY